MWGFGSFKQKGLLANDHLREVVENEFKECDKDQDGFVSLDELTAFIKSNEQVSASSVPLTPTIINNYQRFDQNHDNKLDFEEFVEMITNDGFLKDFTNLGNRYVKFLVVPVSRRTTVRLQRMHTVTGMYEEEVRLKPRHVGMILLSLIQIVLYYSKFKDPLAFQHTKRYQVWRYVTYMFTHNNELHLFGNVAIQMAVGLPLEMVHSWRVLVIYVAGVLGGSLFQSVIHPYDDLAGGSPGVYSIFTAHIATVIMNWREMSQPVAQLLLFGSFTVFDPIYKYIKNRNMDEVSYISHLGGAICGLLVGVNILRNLRKTNAEKIIWWISIFIYIGLMTTFICLEISINRSGT